MRISDWSSDVCSSDLLCVVFGGPAIEHIQCFVAHAFIDRWEVHRRYEANFLGAPSPKRQFEQSAQAFSHWDFGIDGIGENEGPFVFGIAGQVIDRVMEKGTGRKACYSKHEHDFSSIGRGHATIAEEYAAAADAE